MSKLIPTYIEQALRIEVLERAVIASEGDVERLERELVTARAEIVRLTKRKDECSNGWDGALATVQRLERELAEALTGFRVFAYAIEAKLREKNT